jgi:DNA (cytosine-5)-methyltransferase 1
MHGNSLHGIIGGPPCQGFSRIGHRNLDDTRNRLFDHFFRLVAEIRPWFYVAENVHGVLDEKFMGIRQIAFSKLKGYHNLEPLILNAADYGVATSRERVFFIGYLPDKVDLLTRADLCPSMGTETVEVGTALSGLPTKISPDWQTEDQGWQKLSCMPDGRFGRKIFGEIPDSVGEQKSVRLLHQKNMVSGCLGTRHTAEVAARLADLAPGAIDGPSRAVRLRNNGFCPTIRAGTGPEHGSFQALRPIHPTEPRVITPREAARLQGFPDWFMFDRTKWHSFRQIGNSVSPILAETILRAIAGKLAKEGGS